LIATVSAFVRETLRFMLPWIAIVSFLSTVSVRFA